MCCAPRSRCRATDATRVTRPSPRKPRSMRPAKTKYPQQIAKLQWLGIIRGTAKIHQMDIRNQPYTRRVGLANNGQFAPAIGNVGPVANIAVSKRVGGAGKRQTM